MREKIPSDPVIGHVQTENTVRHTKYGRIRGILVVGEGGRSTGVLLYCGLVD